MADITRTDIGRRMYQIHKEKEVEKALEKMRESFGADWMLFSDTDIRLLERLLLEAWAGLDKAAWETIPFGRMKREDVEQILDTGRFIDLDKAPKVELHAGLEKALKKCR